MTDLQPQRRLMVRGLRPGLVERGKIKIGVKGRTITSRKGTEFQPPQKLDHFIITTMQRGPDGNFVRDEVLHKQLGDRPTRIPIRLLYDEIELNFQTRYIAFSGRQVWCQGDGVSAERMGVKGPIECPCRNLARDYDQRKEGKGPPCKLNGRLQVMVDGATGVGGIWVFRTTSWNTVNGLVSSMALIQHASGGRLAGLPLDLTVSPKTATAPDGKLQTVYVVGLEYRGTMLQLRDESYGLMLDDARHEERIRKVHESARAMIAAPLVGDVEEDHDTTAEFYPEQAAAAEGVPVAEPQGWEEDEDPLKRYERELSEFVEEKAVEAMEDLALGVQEEGEEEEHLPEPELQHRQEFSAQPQPTSEEPERLAPPSQGPAPGQNSVTVHTLQGNEQYEGTAEAVRALVAEFGRATLPEQLATLQVENAALIEHTSRFKAWRTFISDGFDAAKARIENETGEVMESEWSL